MKTGKWLIGILILMLLMVGGIVIAEENAVLMLPESLEVIREEAFLGDTSLKKVIVPEGVKGIGSRAFADSSLSEIELPGSLETIADDAFEGCDGLNIIAPVGSYAYEWAEEYFGKNEPEASPAEDFGYSISDGKAVITGYYGDDEVVVVPSKINGMVVEEIGYRAFWECDSLEELVILNGVTSIGEAAFANCSNLSYISIPGSVVSIGEDAFSGCSSVESVMISEGVNFIGKRAFLSCTNLRSIVIPNSITSIGDYAFSRCRSLEKIALSVNLNTIKEATFDGCNSLVSITIPNTITSIGNYAFGDCSSLTNIIIPNSVTSIGDCAFGGCSALTNIIIPDSVTSIGQGVFWDCSGLTNIVIPYSVTSINDNTFRLCKNLSSIILHDGITSIGEEAFLGCYSLTSIVIPEGVKNIKKETFYYCKSLANVTIPKSVISIEDNAFAYCESLESIVIPDGVTSIESAAFYECSSLKSVMIPESVRYIDYYAFYAYPNRPTIYGKLGSYVEEWAADNGYEFLEWTGSAPTATPEPIITPAPSTTPAPTATPETAAEWAVSYDSNYSTITVTASGTPDASKAYLFIAENAAGGHHSGTIDAGKTTASFTIKSLQMPRAAKYKLYVLPADAQLTDDTREEYFIDDVVLPLWEGGMINAVRSGGIDVTSKEKLFVDDEIEIDWDGSFGVETTEISVTLNGAPVTIDAIKDKDGPETIRIDSKAIGAKAGDVLSVTVTVSVPDSDIAAQLTAEGHKAVVTKSWEGTFGKNPAIPTYASISVTNADGSTTVYDKNNPMHLYVGDHNYQKGWKLNVTAEDSSLATYKIYSDNPESVFPYRNESGEVFIEAKKDQDANIYISHIQADSLEDVPEEYRCLVCKVDMPTYRALLIGITNIDESVDENFRPRAAGDLAAIKNLLEGMESTNYQITKSLETTINGDDFTKKGILTQISDVLGKATDNDVSLFCFSGHGSKDGSFFCGDGSSLTGSELRRALDQVPGKKIVLLGSCYSGANIAALTGEDYFVITSASATEPALCADNFGLFYYYVALGSGYDVNQAVDCDLYADVNGDGRMSFYECYTFVYSGVLDNTTEWRDAGETLADGSLVNLQHSQHSTNSNSFILWAK